MKNPWLKKNPMMSLWLSGANTMVGFARGHAIAAAKRQSQTAMTEGTRQMLAFWTGSSAKRRAKRK
jgi:hypothetical protein